MSAFNMSGIVAVWRRQTGSLLGNPLGYLFILAFVLIAGAFLFIPDAFYARNLADLGPLHGLMPWLLVVLLPALAMGAWASERELGTEELILTLPMTVADAVLGKFLAVATYFTLALACSLSNVAVLMFLGTPDLGLVFANYLGWWLAGLVFAAVALVASVQVTMPAIAFVLGVIYCAIVAGGAQLIDWFDGFDRGVAGLGPVVIAIGAIAAALVVAMLQLASRRWRPDSAALVTAQVLATVFGLLLAVNVGRIAQRQGADGDLSSEGLSSISPASVQIVRGADAPVTIAAFISKNLPGELALKAKEVEDKLKAVERSSGGKVELKLYRPANAFDKAGAAAQQHYGVKPFKTLVDSVGGRDVDEVFLGAAVTCAGRSQVIGQFDPGLSVEYELVRAIRSVARAKKPVLGIASTDIKMNGDFDFMSGQSRPAWAIVDEWRKQYDVRDVNLDEPVSDDVAVLIAVQPSLCTQPQLEHLHDYIWAGRPTLIMEDPLPMFAGPQFAPSQPRKPSNPYQQQEAPTPKADLKPLWSALGVEMGTSDVAWSDWNPSHMFRGIPPSVVWCMRTQGSIADPSVASVTTGIDSLLVPWAGMIYPTTPVDGVPHPTVTALVKPSTNVRWGTSRFDDYFTQNPMNGGLMPKREQPRFRLGDQSKVPSLAVLITGTMPSAFPKVPADAAKKADEKKDEAKKDDKPEEKPEAKKGVPSPKPVHVILIADTDLAHDQFFQFYRNENNQLSKDEFAVLRNLRNVQFLANAVDALAGDDAFLAVRTRRPQSRPLDTLAKVLEVSDKRLRDEVSKAEGDAEAAIAKAQADFDNKKKAVENNDQLDESTKMQQTMLIAQSEQRKLEAMIEDINRAKDDSIRAAKAERNAAIDDNRWWVRVQAVGIPALVMATIVLVVLINRLRLESRNIPSSRKRTNP